MVDSGGLLIEVMPTRKTSDGKREVDGVKLAHILRGWQPQSAVIEKVGARPKQGVCSMFTFGQGVGAVKGVLEALGIPYGEFRPQAWQKLVANLALCDTSGAGAKENALRAAHALFPRANFLASSRCKKPHSGMVDAALIACFAARIGGVSA
jgi:crossover junction endodeoxyribonuclease RuvC